MDDRTIDKVFAGCLEDLPSVSSKIVRIFTSSTFTDTILERNILVAEVYPKIKEYCREKHGLEFQVVDMRWGVRDEATDDHMITDLCIREIKNCQRLSMGPNFVVFLGQKYGYRPNPTIILATELNLLKETLSSMNISVHLLDLWYKKDTNAVPHIFILQPISSILTNFYNKRVPKLQSQDQATWWDTHSKMQKLLRKAAYMCFNNGTMDEKAMHNYFMSVTEREVTNGLLNVENTKAHCLGYIRHINNINLQNLKKASNFLDISNRGLDTEAGSLLGNLRDERLVEKLEAPNLIRYTMEWIGREGIAAETHEEYLTAFLAHFYKNMTKLVDRAMRKENSSAQGVITTEILQHLHTSINLVGSFYGREESLIKAHDYITGLRDTPLVLYGAGGCGKTSLLAKMASMSFLWHAEKSGAVPILILRFLGTTPDSSALNPMLISLCQQISYNFMLPMEDIPDDLVPLTAHLKHLLTYGTGEQPLVLFLDSVDQMTGPPGANNKFKWLPFKLPKHCKIVISCVHEPEDDIISQDYLQLRSLLDDAECFMEVASLGEKLAIKVIRGWLMAAQRDISNYQSRVVCNALAECSLPIFVKVVFGEICRWKSYSKPQDTQLAGSVIDSILKVFERIEMLHGRLLVSHALAYVTAAKSGLSETELEDLISLDDKVLDDVFQYHMPPVRRIPPVLWTRIRSDLPNYLSEREAGGVRVISWYHRQFGDAARERYFGDEAMAIYFHSSIADYFLGIWGGGNPKPFKYTEIQRHRFNLVDKKGSADRKVPFQPLVYYGKDGKVSGYNLRKFIELPYHLVRATRFSDLYNHVLFNYQWLHTKIASCPLQSALSDYEDACVNINDKKASREDMRRVRREIMLVAEAIRLGGCILIYHPQMLASQLIGRLLPEIGMNPNVKSLLQQCDTEGIHHNALIPSYHCMHTPGGPLKYSLEGHQFAVFGFCLTADFRYIISISNKFVTWDLSTWEICREVIPGIEGILQGLVISPDNRYGAAFSNINQVVLVNLLTNEFSILDNPIVDDKSITGLYLLNTHLIVYGLGSWVLFNIVGEMESVSALKKEEKPILNMSFDTLQDFFVVHWSGCLDDTKMELATVVNAKAIKLLPFHGALVVSVSRTRLYTCIADHENAMVEMNLVEGGREWEVTRVYDTNTDKLDQLQFSQEETYIVGSFMMGYKVFPLASGKMVTLLLPDPDNGIRNISTKLLESNSCVLSKDATFAIAGVRNNLYVWDAISGDLLKNLDAHFGRILKIISMTIGNWNSVITSSIDRTVKIWNIDNIFEKVHPISRHELPIESISISPIANLVATATRSCVGIWDLKNGKLIGKLADSPLGAIVTHAVINKAGTYIICEESGSVIVWSVEGHKVLFKQEQDQIKQMFFIDKDNIFITASKIGGADLKSRAVARQMPTGKRLYEFKYPIKNWRNLVATSDSTLLVGPGFEKLKDILYIFHGKTGVPSHKIILKYANFKEYLSILAIPKRATQVALIDSDKGNIIDVKTRKFIRSVPKWGGQCTKDGKFGLYVADRGGLELIDLKHGKQVQTFIPKVPEGVFTTIAMFNRTDEYVLYYHSGRKTIRVFRTSDGEQIANYCVPAELSAMDTSTDGKSIVLGALDGCLTVLTIADPANPKTVGYLLSLPSRDEKTTEVQVKRCAPFYFWTAAKMRLLAARAQEKVSSAARASKNKVNDFMDNGGFGSSLSFTELTQKNSAFKEPDTVGEDEYEDRSDSDAETYVNEEDDDDARSAGD